MDEPKSLKCPEARALRLEAIEKPHVAPLTLFVRRLRESMGSEFKIPYFDPFDGGIYADCLFLLEAPGPKAIDSKFISRNNPDETAKNFFLLNNEAGIDRSRTVVWNIIPWYIGSCSKIRPANTRDLVTAAPALLELLSLLPMLHSIVLVGNKAATAKAAIGALIPKASIHVIPHPSPMFVNRLPENRELILDGLRLVKNGLPQRSG